MAIISLRLPDELLELLKFNAERNGCSLSRYIRSTLEKGLSGTINSDSMNHTITTKKDDLMLQKSLENTFLLRTLIKHHFATDTDTAKNIINECAEMAKAKQSKLSTDDV